MTSYIYTLSLDRPVTVDSVQEDDLAYSFAKGDLFRCELDHAEFPKLDFREVYSVDFPRAKFLLRADILNLMSSESAPTFIPEESLLDLSLEML